MAVFVSDSVGPVADSTGALVAALELASEELSPHELVVAAGALSLARLVDSPGEQAVAPLVKEWRRHVDEIEALVRVRTAVEEDDPVEEARRGLRAV